MDRSMILFSNKPICSFTSDSSSFSCMICLWKSTESR